MPCRIVPEAEVLAKIAAGATGRPRQQGTTTDVVRRKGELSCDICRELFGFDTGGGWRVVDDDDLESLCSRCIKLHRPELLKHPEWLSGELRYGPGHMRF